MIDSIVFRYLAIVAGTVFWDLGAILQKQQVQAQTRTTIAKIYSPPIRIGGRVGAGLPSAGSTEMQKRRKSRNPPGTLMRSDP